MQRLTVNGVELACVDQGTGVPVVFVHGALGDYRSWHAQLRPFACRYRVIAYSRRYHHPNDCPEAVAGYTPDQHAAGASWHCPRSAGL